MSLMRNKSLKVLQYKILLFSSYRAFKFFFAEQNQHGELCLKEKSNEIWLHTKQYFTTSFI